MVYVRKGSISIASDLTTADLVGKNSLTRTAVTDLLDETVVGVVEDVISDSPTVVAAAAAAVDGALTTAGVVDGALNNTWMSLEGDYVFGALTDENGALSPFVWTPEGKVHPWSAKRIREDAAGMSDTFSTDYFTATVDDAGNILYAVLPDGRFYAPGGIVGAVSDANGASQSSIIPVYTGTTLSVLDQRSGQITPVTTGGTVAGEPQVVGDAVLFRVGTQLRWSRGGASFPALADKTKWAGWGSSTVGGLNTHLTAEATSVGATYFNGGSGADLAEHTLARIGVRPASLAAFTIPAGTTAVAVTPLNIPDSIGVASADQVTVAGVPGTLAKIGGAGWTFTRTTAGSAVAVAEGTQAYSTLGSSHRGDVTILNLGKNNLTGVGGTPNVSQVVQWTIDAYNYVTHLSKQVIVFGHFVNTDTTAESTTRTLIEACNRRLADEFGDRYIDLQSLLTSADIWAATGITPTATDLEQQAIGNKPPSLSSDAGHLNSAGTLYLASVIKNRIVALGWA